MSHFTFGDLETHNCNYCESQQTISYHQYEYFIFLDKLNMELFVFVLAVLSNESIGDSKGVDDKDNYYSWCCKISRYLAVTFAQITPEWHPYLTIKF